MQCKLRLRWQCHNDRSSRTCVPLSAKAEPSQLRCPKPRQQRARRTRPAPRLSREQTMRTRTSSQIRRRLKSTAEALREAGFTAEARAVGQIRCQAEWSSYVTRLLDNVQSALRRCGALDKLRFLLYPSRLTDRDRQWIRDHGEGVRWLGKRKESAVAASPRSDGTSDAEPAQGV